MQGHADGSYDRQLHTKAGEVTLQVPKLGSLPFETAIIERYRWRETSIEEALTEMYLAGVSVRRVEDITQALWGTRMSMSTVNDQNQRMLRLAVEAGVCSAYASKFDKLTDAERRELPHRAININPERWPSVVA